MKKLTFVLSAVIAMMVVFSACETEDLDAPVIDLVDGDMEIVLNDPTGFVEPGYTATDEQDGDLTNNVIVTGTVDVTKIGTYELVYSVSDKAGNKTSVKRKVDVIVNQATYTGTWAVVDVVTGDNPGTWNYNATVTASSANTMRLLVANFGGWATAFVANVDFDKFGNFTVPNQPMTGSGFTGTIEGTGTTSADGLTLTIEYDVSYSDGDFDQSVSTWTKSK